MENYKKKYIIAIIIIIQFNSIVDLFIYKQLKIEGGKNG